MRKTDQLVRTVRIDPTRTASAKARTLARRAERRAKRGVA